MLTFQIQAVFWYFLIIILYFLRSNAIPVQLTDEYAELDYFGIERPVHLNSWAVQVNGSEQSADELAKKYGFKNIGKVGNLVDTYHFCLPGGRNILLNSISEILLNDSQVHKVVQQEHKEQMKKGFSFPNDPLWKKQWSLYNTGRITKATHGLDLNVVHAWMQGLTGAGVVISVVDDGLDHYHQDLKANYDSSASYNYVEYRTDPTPSNLFKETHGTKCAGIIGMQRDNAVCGVGVAYNAKLGAIRLDLSSSSDILESSALGHRNNYIQIYSNSWGPNDNGYTVDGPGQLLEQTLENGIKKGRNGFGNIYVWAAGNGGQNGDSCAADGYASSMYTIAVGSADEYGRQAVYDENCPAKMAVTFGLNSGKYQLNSVSTHGQVPSTNTNKRCTDALTGTSVSASLTAGVIALALQVNSTLTWRDIQYLIVYTSNPSKLKFGNWTTNGAGLRVSPKFGFGAVDAEALVTRARYWTTVPERVSCFIKPRKKSGIVYQSEPFSTMFKINKHRCSIKYIEHVVVHATVRIRIDDHYGYPDYFDEDYIYDNPFIIFFKGPRRGAINMSLRSPHGTVSNILPYRIHDYVNTQGFYHWPFMSVYHWGEDPTGLWNFSMTFKAQGGHIRLSNLSMTLYGTNEIPEAVQHIPNQCDENCARGCSYNTSSEYCDECKSFRMVDTLLCVSSCPSNYCNVAGYCQECSSVAMATTATAIVVPIVMLGLLLAVSIALLCVYKKWRNYKARTKL